MATPPPTLSGRARKQSGQSAKGADGDDMSMSEGEGGGARDEESCSTSANQINEQMQRMLNQLYVKMNGKEILYTNQLYLFPLM